jgi:D-glycero-beta-D-manno-heptose-7-phosphate kinase
MVSFTEQRLRQLCNTFKGTKVAIIGDLMVDRYYWGNVTRVSPEAPVPVVDVVSESVRLGGAANVANNIQMLGGETLLIGLIGDDHAGELCLNMLTEGRFTTNGIVKDSSRPTTIKTRVIAHSQHVVRIDNESKIDCPEHLQRQIIDTVKDNIDAIDGIILEDYNKGTITKDIIREVISLARRHDKIVTVDPKFENFLEYKNVTLFKPNRREVEEVLGGRLRTIEDVVQAGKKLLRDLSAQNVLLTRGEDGMSLFEGNGDVTHLGIMADNVQDVSGAGDTVISTLTMALVSGATIREASTLANCAGGVVVGEVGIVPVQLQDLIEAALRHTNNRNPSN